MNYALKNVDYYALSPFLILLAGALGLLVLEIISRKVATKWSFYFTLAIFGITWVDSYTNPKSSNELIVHWINFDHLSHILTFFFLAVGIAATLLSRQFLTWLKLSQGEFYFFVVASIFGLLLISSAADFLMIFLGIETLSLALYVMCTYAKEWKISHEAAIKYFLIGSTGAAFLLYGIALVYGAIGTTQLNQLFESYLKINNLPDTILFNAGMAFISVGLLFKAAIVPFHIWAPDVYAGAPTPVTAFMSVGTKVGAFAALARVFLIDLSGWNLYWNEAMAFFSIITLLYANYVAIQQTQLRRFFAYSGISHSGFALMAIAVGTPDAVNVLLFYLGIYAFATLGAFSVLTYLDKNSSGVVVEDLEGLFYTSPMLATIFSICLLTLAGIPPTIGFFGKFYLFKIALEAHFYSLVVVALFTTVLSAYFYLKFIMVMLETADRSSKVIEPKLLFLGSLCALFLLWFSISPETLYQLFFLQES